MDSNEGIFGYFAICSKANGNLGKEVGNTSWTNGALKRILQLTTCNGSWLKGRNVHEKAKRLQSPIKVFRLQLKELRSSREEGWEKYLTAFVSLHLRDTAYSSSNSKTAAPRSITFHTPPSLDHEEDYREVISSRYSLYQH